MLLAKVVGMTSSTVKHRSLEGQRMIVVQPYGPDGKSPDGDPLLAVDLQHGSGKGQDVMITSDGRTAREMLNSDTTPVRWTVIGIRDA